MRQKDLPRWSQWVRPKQAWEPSQASHGGPRPQHGGRFVLGFSCRENKDPGDGGCDLTAVLGALLHRGTNDLLPSSVDNGATRAPVTPNLSSKHKVLGNMHAADSTSLNLSCGAREA